MRRSGNPSATGAAIRLLVRGLRSGGFRSSESADSWLRSASPRRRISIERDGIRAAPERVAAYLRATAGAEAAGLVEAGSPLPPLYPAVWETAIALELLGTDDLPFPRGGLVHLGGETVQIRPAEVGEPIVCRAELQKIEPAAGGARITIQCRNWNARSRLCSENSMILLARTGSDAGNRSRAAVAAVPAAIDADHEWVALEEWPLTPSHGRRYARASGDYNPIHLWAWTARPFGFPRPILQGFCTEAMVAHTLIARCMNGQYSALRRLDISFRSPVALPTRARLLISRTTAGGCFRVTTEGGTKPVAEGSWVGQG